MSGNIQTNLNDADINFIVSKLIWKPSMLSYCLLISFIIIMILLVVSIYILNCNYNKLKIELEHTNKQLMELTNNNKSEFENNVRYFMSRSEKNSDNSNLLKKIDSYNYDLIAKPVFENEKEDLLLYKAVSGQ